jgi:hypothetical protein
MAWVMNTMLGVIALTLCSVLPVILISGQAHAAALAAKKRSNH